MADTLQNISIPHGVWLNVYTHPIITAAGISVGDQISTQNLGDNSVLTHAGATAPTSADGYRAIKTLDVWANDAGDTGAWVFSRFADGLINVRAV